MDRRAVAVFLGLLVVAGAGTVFVVDREAERRALAGEETYLRNHLSNASCLESYGTEATTAVRRASVARHWPDGVVVRVTHPYWYSTDRLDADGASEAVYLVHPDGVERLRGDAVRPCP